MNTKDTNQLAGQILEFLESVDAKPDQKIAALEVASWTIRSVLNAELLRITFAQVLDNFNNIKP